MASIIEVPLASEMLTNEEIYELSGCCRRADQLAWLKKNHWVYLVNKAGRPVIGRLYARMKLAGIEPGRAANDGGWTLDISKVK